MKIGANYLGNKQCEFVVWAPFAQSVALKVVSDRERVIPMKPKQRGYWEVKTDSIPPHSLYMYRLDQDRDRPDPASHSQPKGVHGPSQVIDHHSYRWNDHGWTGIPLSETIIYKLHVGTFTPEGTFEAIVPRLPALRDLGITALELMPVAQFPGERNWGYDGVYPFAVQQSYGGSEGLERLVDQCHLHGMAAILDVVYNHLGPEGNYFSDFGPYFTDIYKTPWGPAINFDDSYSDEVRHFFIQNALYWFEQFHVDALRLDAIHAIRDFSAKPFLQALAEKTKACAEKTKRPRYLIAETNQNDARVIRPPELGGYGIDAQWSDDFHHALHTLLTGEDQGYYMDFGRIGDLVKALEEGFVYSGQFSKYRNRSHGNSSKDRPGHQFVICSQNHDQIGNRVDGARLSRLIPFEGLKLAAATVLLTPYIPLLFMGEEYGEEAPFFYFVDHSDPELIRAVRKGRKEEFKAFGWRSEPPDPQSLDTFLRSKLRWNDRDHTHHRVLLDFYKSLLDLRKDVPALSHLDKEGVKAWANDSDRILYLNRWHERSEVFCLFNFNKNDHTFVSNPLQGNWEKLLDSSDGQWNGPGSLLPGGIRGLSAAVYRKEKAK